MPKRLPVIEVRGEMVICGGPHPTAPLKLDPDKPQPAVTETHQMLRPAFHLGELEIAGGAPVRVGDIIEERADGRRYHCPRSAGQQLDRP
jgi:hypothetical protein